MTKKLINNSHRQIGDQSTKGGLLGIFVYALSKNNVDPVLIGLLVPVVASVLAYLSTLIGNKELACLFIPKRQTRKMTRPYTISKQPVVTAPLAGMATWVRLCCKHSDGSLWNNGIWVNRDMRKQTRHHQQPCSRAGNRLVVPLATTKTRSARRPQSVTRIHKQTFAKRRHTRHRTCDRLRAITQLALRSWHMANR
jgi:hypothetical protein